MKTRSIIRTIKQGNKKIIQDGQTNEAVYIDKGSERKAPIVTYIKKGG